MHQQLLVADTRARITELCLHTVHSRQLIAIWEEVIPDPDGRPRYFN